MIRIQQVKCPVGHTKEELVSKICHILRIRPQQLVRYSIVRRSLDARKKPELFYSYMIDCELDREKTEKKLCNGKTVLKTPEKVYRFPEEGTEKLRYRLMSDEETRKYYPFDFVLWITYELREKEVLVSWEVENRSGEVMSFTIGGHPGFRFEKEGEQKEDYELYFPENTEFTATAVDLVNGTGKPDQKYRVKLTDHTLVLSDQLFDVDTLVVDDAQIREVWLRRKATGQLYAGVRCIDEFCSFGIWSLPKGPYVCLEPWAGRCDDEGFCEDISQKPGINRAKPGECWKKQYAILIG